MPFLEATPKNKVKLGHRLKLFRVAAGLKQSEIALGLGVSKNYVYMVESGRREASRDYIESFSKLVHIPMSVIYLEPKKTADKKTRKLLEKLITLLTEYSVETGVGKPT